MRKIYAFTILLLFVCNYMFAQTPQAINYQGLARDNNGTVIANHLVAFRLSILGGSSTGTAIYVETHSKTTDGFGLFNLLIGQGTIVSGSFSTINWGINSYYLKVEIDPTGGTNYQLAGVSQFASVPYAMYATSSGSSTPGSSPGDMLYWNGTAWVVVPAGVHGQQLTFCNGIPTWGGCPPLVTTSAAGTVSSTTANCGGNVTNDGGASVTARGVCYSTSPNPTIANSNVTSGTGTGSFTSNLTALSAGTTYYIRAYATNMNGTAYGNQIVITTLALPVVTTTAASAITSTTAQSGGNVSSDGGATVTARGICYSTSVNPTTANSIVAGGSGTGSFTSNLTGLTTGTIYHIRAYATNSVGTAYGDDIIITTLALPTITTTAVSSITATTATSGGNITADGGAAVTTRGVCYSTSSAPTIANSIVANGAGTGSFLASLTTLLPNTIYYIRAYATNSVGTAYGNEISFTTLSPPLATTKAPTSITLTGATLNGSANAMGTSTTVSFEYGTTTSYGSTITATPSTVTGSVNTNVSAGLTGLSTGVTYHYRIKAVNTYGTTYGADSTFTPSSAPNATTNSATSITNTSATVNGQVNANGLSTIVSFDYGTTTSYGNTITATQSPVTGSTITNVNVNLSSLTTGTIYHYRVKAVNALGTTYGADSIFTPSSLPSATTKAATSITATSGTLNGQVNANGLSTTVTFDYGTTTSYGSTITATQSPVTGSTLTSVSANLTSLTTGTVYHFRVKAVNALGTVYGADSTFTPSIAPTAITRAASNIIDTAATLNAQVNANGLSTTISFEYGTSISYGSTLAATPATATGSSLTTVSANITGLTTGVTYHFRVKAVNALGTTYGADSIFTPSLAPLAFTKGATNVTKITATLNGQANAKGLSTTVYFQYGRTISYDSTVLATPNIVTGNTSTNVSLNITGLVTGVTYHYRVKAVNALGTVYGADSTFIPSSVPTATTKAATNIIDTTAKLNAKVNANGLATTVSFDYGTSTSYGTNIAATPSTVTGSADSTVTANLSGLTAATVYHYRVKAINALSTVYGNDTTFTTLAKPTLTTNAIDSITSNSARSGGNITNNGGDSITARGICYDTVASPTILKNIIPSGTGSGSFIAKLTGLTANKTYYVRAYATNSAGTAYGSEVSFTTLQNISTGTVTDFDGNVYDTVRIGTQTWLKQNLKSTHYSNGTTIGISTPDTVYGGYYTWSQTMNGVSSSSSNPSGIQGACPTGYHVPSDAEWKQLEMSLGMSQADADLSGMRGTNEAGQLKETGFTHWNSPNTGATNSSGFTALPAGVNGNGQERQQNIYLWSSTEVSGGTVWMRLFQSVEGRSYRLSYGNEGLGASVRCIKNSTVQVVLPTITTNAIDSITTTTARTGGNITNNGGDSITARGICYDTVASPTILKNIIASGTGSGSFISKLTGLTANKTYYIRAYATNSAGTAYGSEVSFTTFSYPAIDLDGFNYDTIVIGTQTWMKQDLKTTHYANGDSIPHITDNNAWGSLTTGAYCDYNNTPNNSTTYGRLYNFYTATDSRNLCPTGWHVPSDAEWTTLTNYLGGAVVAGNKLKEIGTTHWSANSGATNQTGFTALPSGIRYTDGHYGCLGTYVYWWTSTPTIDRYMYTLDVGLNTYGGHAPQFGFSVRCLKNQ